MAALIEAMKEPGLSAHERKELKRQFETLLFAGMTPKERVRRAEKMFFDALDSGADSATLRQLHQDLRETENWLKRYTRETREPLVLESADAIANEPPPLWTVEGIIPERGIGTIYGPPKTYKSFLAMDALAHIAEGRGWFGRRVTRRPCVYIPFEGKGGLSSRFKALREENDGEVPFHVMRRKFNFRNQQDRDELVGLLNHLTAPMLVIDTLAAAAGSHDENGSKDMGEIFAILQELQEQLPGSLVMAVDHSGKDASKGMRGWSGKAGAVDFALECSRGPGLTAGFTTALAKDGPMDLKFAFEMKAVGGSLVVGERREATGEQDAKLTLNEAEGIIVGHIRDHKPANQREVIDALTGKVGKTRIEQIWRGLVMGNRIKKSAAGHYEVLE